MYSELLNIASKSEFDTQTILKTFKVFSEAYTGKTFNSLENNKLNELERVFVNFSKSFETLYPYRNIKNKKDFIAFLEYLDLEYIPYRNNCYFKIHIEELKSLFEQNEDKEIKEEIFVFGENGWEIE